MKITSKMLEYMLKQRQIDICVQGNPECDIQIASLVCKTSKAYPNVSQFKSGFAYIDLNKSNRITPSTKDGYVFIVSVKPQKYTLEDELKVLDIANQLLTQLNEWDLKLKDALISNQPLSEFAYIGEQIIDLPFCYVNKNLIILMRSQNYDTSSNGKVRDAKNSAQNINSNSLGTNSSKDSNASNTCPVSSEFIPPNIVIDLIEEDRFEQASTKTEPFYYLSEDGMAYCINTHIDNVYAARFVTILDDGEMSLHPGAEQILGHFESYIKTQYNMLAIGSAQISRQDDSLHQLLSDISTGSKIPNTSILQNNLLSYGWLIEDIYKVIWLEFIDNVSWSSAAYYMACQIESMWTNSCTISTDRGVIWLLNITRMPSNISQSSFRKSYTKLLTDYVCKSGESSEFGDLNLLPRYLKEAKLSLEYGLKKNPSSWHFSFDTYAFDYILDKSVANLLPEQICENNLLKLYEIDKSEQTDYAKTLVSYLQNNCNSTHAADELFIHRTTLLHRLDRICELVTIDFDDPDQKLMILLSAKMFGM